MVKELTKFQNEALNQHNNYRALHEAASLVWSKKLANKAQKWAEILAALGTIKHEDSPTEGENVECVNGKSVDANTLISTWYNEKEHFIFGSEGQPNNVLHFSQMVWTETTDFAIYYKKIDDKIYIVAKYSPPGNIVGKFQACVRPLNETSSKNYQEQTIGETNEQHYVYLDPVGTQWKHNISQEYYNQEMLSNHNRVREIHNAAALKINHKLKDMAQKFAEKYLLFRVKEKKMPNFPPSKYGKSICTVVGNHLPHPKSICSVWYKGGFTQMVWKNTKKIGVGIFWGQDFSVVVALYYPAGNIHGEFQQNVEPELLLESKIE